MTTRISWTRQIEVAVEQLCVALDLDSRTVARLDIRPGVVVHATIWKTGEPADEVERRLAAMPPVPWRGTYSDIGEEEERRRDVEREILEEKAAAVRGQGGNEM